MPVILVETDPRERPHPAHGPERMHRPKVDWVSEYQPCFTKAARIRRAREPAPAPPPPRAATPPLYDEEEMEETNYGVANNYSGDFGGYSGHHQMERHDSKGFGGGYQREEKWGGHGDNWGSGGNENQWGGDGAGDEADDTFADVNYQEKAGEDDWGTGTDWNKVDTASDFNSDIVYNNPGGKKDTEW